MDLYNDKARYDSFLNAQANVESGFRGEQDNYSNQLQSAMLAKLENKQIGSEMFLTSIPQALLEGQQIYSKIKDVYNKAQAVSGQVQKVKDGVSDAVTDVTSKAQGLLEDVRGQVQSAADSAIQSGRDAISSAVQGATDMVSSLVDPKDAIGTIRSATSRDVEFTNPLFDANIDAPVVSLPETFGNVKNYLGGQIGDIGSRVAVLPNAESAIGSLKQALPKVPMIDTNLEEASSSLVGGLKEGVSDLAKSGSSIVSDVTDVASSIGSDILKKGGDILAESSVPIIGDVLAGVGLATSLYEGVKGLFEKGPSAPAPPPIDIPSTIVQQAGI